MTWKRGVRIGVGLTLLAVVLWVVMPQVMRSISRQALITARVAHVEAPIDGRLAGEGPNLGATVAAGRRLATVHDPRVDRTRLWDVAYELARLDLQVPALVQRRARLERMADRLVEQGEAYAAGRRRQLEAQLAGARARLAAMRARANQADADLNRKTALRRKAVVAQAQLDSAEAGYREAASDVQAAARRVQALQVAREAADGGTFLGDSYNDQPYSAQRLDEIRLELARLDAQLAIQRQRRPELAALHGRLSRQVAMRATADLASPVDGRIWRIAADDGEFVRKGQSVVELLDCKTVSVAATVSEGDYNLIEIGDTADFRPHGGSAQVTGRVVKLAGPGGRELDPRLAIAPQIAQADDFLVYLRFPDLIEACKIGRTGTVVFQEEVFLDRVASLVRGFLDRMP